MSAESAPAHHAGRQPDLNPSKLSIEINSSTRDVHDSINKIIMVRVGLGLRDVRNFREGILSFFYIYKTFEEEWSRLLTNPPLTISERKLHILRTLHTPLLLRTEPFLKDLSFYFSLQTPQSALEKFSTPTTPARIAYANHIREAIKEEPLVIIAYAHNMYLALFAGGKIIKSKMLSQVRFFPQLEGMTREQSQRLGTNMFMWEVEEGKEEEIVKGGFKRRLASVEGEIEEKERKAIIMESREIFIQNGKLIEELDRLTREQGSGTSAVGWLGWILMALLAYRVCAQVFPRVLESLVVVK
ncbi:hypothetical protein BGX38DRAFT_1195869 [Terfezia claveryi]|nr:hypothetical protein BGX38DRAFT_1195869 [Terfezia claveryi]